MKNASNPALRKLARAGQPGGPRTDECCPLFSWSAFFCLWTVDRGPWTMRDPPISRKSLEGADIDGRLFLSEYADLFALVLLRADPAAYRRKRILLPYLFQGGPKIT